MSGHIKTAVPTEFRRRTRRLASIALFTALISVGAFIKLPTPLVPVTMQFVFCLLSGLLLGWKDGAISVLIYLIMGLAGIPVFTAGGGITYVLNPTFGYMIGFVLASAAAGFIARGRRNRIRPSFLRLFLAALCALIIVDTLGVLYLYSISNFYLAKPFTFSAALISGCALFLPTDGIWCVAASFLAHKIIPVLDKNALPASCVKRGIYFSDVYTRESVSESENGCEACSEEYADGV